MVTCAEAQKGVYSLFLFWFLALKLVLHEFLAALESTQSKRLFPFWHNTLAFFV